MEFVVDDRAPPLVVGFGVAFGLEYLVPVDPLAAQVDELLRQRDHVRVRYL